MDRQRHPGIDPKDDSPNSFILAKFFNLIGNIQGVGNETSDINDTNPIFGSLLHPFWGNRWNPDKSEKYECEK